MNHRRMEVMFECLQSASPPYQLSPFWQQLVRQHAELLEMWGFLDKVLDWLGGE
jgi:hypothetical protein